MRPEPERRTRPQTYLFLLLSFALVACLSHAPYVTLPFFWDELGYFVPAALDLYRSHALVPHSTLANVHPPGVMAYLAAAWSLAGYSIPATRIAMLLLASAALLVVFLLAIRLTREPLAAGRAAVTDGKFTDRSAIAHRVCRCTGELKGAPAFAAVTLLVISPLFYTQAMMAQLDMPAMLLTALALLFFLEDRPLASAMACTALVLVKETGLVVPVVFGAWLLKERRVRHAALFLAPAVTLGAWLAVLFHHTGHIFGNREFTQYNLIYPLHPGRFAGMLVRRAWYLFGDDFHWAGTVALVAGWRAGVYRSRPWRIAGWLAAAQLAVVTILGGAGLERYLLPVLPLLYIAVAAGWSVMKTGPRRLSHVILFGGLMVSNFWYAKVWPFPYENNLAMADFVELQRTAAGFVESEYFGKTIYTAWPLTDALRRPEFGYVRRPMRAEQTAAGDFRRSAVFALDPKRVEVFVLYSLDSDPPANLLRLPFLAKLRERYLHHEPQITPEECEERLGLSRIARWTRRGQWIEVLVRPGLAPGVSTGEQQVARAVNGGLPPMRHERGRPVVGD